MFYSGDWYNLISKMDQHTLRLNSQFKWRLVCKCIVIRYITYPHVNVLLSHCLFEHFLFPITNQDAFVLMAEFYTSSSLINGLLFFYGCVSFIFSYYPVCVLKNTTYMFHF
ncbi:hypothetical protein Hdeb2414_s0680g00934711 [Helianthus debilis subsp. tardiflorus]